MDLGGTTMSSSRHRSCPSPSPRRMSQVTPARSSASRAPARRSRSPLCDVSLESSSDRIDGLPTAMGVSACTGEPDDRPDGQDRGNGQDARHDAHRLDDVWNDVSTRRKGGDGRDDPDSDADRDTRNGRMRVVAGPACQQADDDDSEHDHEDDEEDGLHANLRSGRSMASRRNGTGSDRVPVTNLYRSLSPAVGARHQRWSTVGGCPSASHASDRPASSPSSPLASGSWWSWPWRSSPRQPRPAMTRRQSRARRSHPPRPISRSDPPHPRNRPSNSTARPSGPTRPHARPSRSHRASSGSTRAPGGRPCSATASSRSIGSTQPASVGSIPERSSTRDRSSMSTFYQRATVCTSSGQDQSRMQVTALD